MTSNDFINKKKYTLFINVPCYYYHILAWQKSRIFFLSNALMIENDSDDINKNKIKSKTIIAYIYKWTNKQTNTITE